MKIWPTLALTMFELGPPGILFAVFTHVVSEMNLLKPSEDFFEVCYVFVSQRHRISICKFSVSF